MNSAVVTKISGPPGTGKTSTLINVVESLLSSGVAPDNIIYTTYTRAGAYEARDRACEKFHLSPAQFAYFRTLHSLCYQALPTTPVMTARDWFALAHILGVSMSVMAGGDEIFETPRSKQGDRMLYIWNMARMLCMEPKQFHSIRDLYGIEDNFSWQTLEHFINTVDAYKKSMGKRDFTDIIEEWIKTGRDITADYVIIDEAQDLSPLMWHAVRKLCTNAKHVWIAGDDDQCIHEWSGADPKLFIELQAREYTVLPQSRRVPKSVHVVANILIEQIQHRLVKDYHWRDGEEGSVQRIESLDCLDMSKGSWMLLARNNIYLKQYERHCIEKGYLYTGPKINGFSADSIDAIKSWKDLCAGKSITAFYAKKLYALMSRKERVANGFKQVMDKADDSRLLTMQDLKNEFGLCYTEGPWREALNLMSEEEASYLSNVEKTSSLTDMPRIIISSIHGVKGAEADNVVILPNMAQYTYNQYLLKPDSEHRVFYVGVTRAKQNLYILPASNERAYPL